MSAGRCRFYLQGNCRFGSSCRFLHEEPHQSRSNRSVSQNYYDTDSTSRGYKDYNNHDEYKQKNYEPERKSSNYSYNKRDYNSRNNYNSRDDYNNRDNYNNDYEDDASSSNHYDHPSQRQHNVKNYYKEDDYNQGRKHSYKTNNDNYSHKYHTDTNKVHSDSNRYSNYHKEDDYYQESKHSSETNNDNYSHKWQDKSNRYNSSEAEKYIPEHRNVNNHKQKLMMYEKEIKTFQAHVNELSMSNIWPFTCFHPIGHKYAIQPVGSLNFIDISFEEIRCDYYIIKSISADPGLMHNHTVGNLLLEAQKQKNDIFTFGNHTQKDLLATFDKCEQSKSPNFINTIQMDHKSYWDMSIRSLKNPENKTALESFSFVTTKSNTNTKNEGQLKILMQTEIYGKMDNETFAQDQFTDFIPIMPPSMKYCV